MAKNNQDTSATRSSETAEVWVKPEMMSLHLASTATSPSGDGIMTPMSSYFEQPPINPWSVPRPGKTYRIHLKGTDEMIMVAAGKVVVQPMADAKLGGGWNWACVEAKNWLGFRNHVSGRFLGGAAVVFKGFSRGICAESSYHLPDESFCVRLHPDGGYLLLVNVSQKGGMEQVGLGSDGKSLVGKKKGGALWLFEEV